ncbi:MAG: hypothetical protein WBH08_06640 [Methanothrix sp.]|uniref:hypothetical protein n=1 Tax=Methanothrix sp. TaxID=90426 RepID=UPI003C708CA3
MTGFFFRAASRMMQDAQKVGYRYGKDASEFDAVYYRELLEKAWEEVAFVIYAIYIIDCL